MRDETKHPIYKQWEWQKENGESDEQVREREREQHSQVIVILHKLPWLALNGLSRSLKVQQKRAKKKEIKMKQIAITFVLIGACNAMYSIHTHTPHRPQLIDVCSQQWSVDDSITIFQKRQKQNYETQRLANTFTASSVTPHQLSCFVFKVNIKSI